MHFKRLWRTLQRSLSRPRSIQRSAFFLEPLEERTVPTVVWSTAGSRVVVDSGGPVITHADVDLVFWGAGWSRAQALRTNVINSVTTILNSTYLSGLSQYRGIGNAQLLRTDDISSTSPASHSTNLQYDAFVRTNINDGALPVTPLMDSQILYMVIPQPGTTDPVEGYGGAHYSDSSIYGRFHFGWVENVSSVDDMTYGFSHELTEAVTDPEPNFIPTFWVPSTDEEICDGEAQNYSYRLNGVLVQSSLSQRDHAYEVYGGTTQRFTLTSNRLLMVNGDQLASPDDAITIDQRSGGYKIVLNGEVAQFDAFDFYTGVLDVSTVMVKTGSGNDTVNIEKTVAGATVTVNLGSGNDTVNLGPTSQTLSALIGAITLKGGSGSDTLNLFDQGLRASETYTVSGSTITRSGIPRVAYSNLTNVIINTTNSTDMINVQSMPAGTTVTMNGGSGSNTITDQAADNLWTIMGSNSGSLSGSNSAGLLMFDNVQTLVGGNNNTFRFLDSAVESGNIRSGSGSSLDYSAYTTDISVNLQTAKATGVGGVFSGIQSFTGGSGMNTLIGGNQANVWNLTGMNGGNVSGSATVAFNAFQNLQGGTASNTFVFSDGAGISGNLDGGGGGSLDYSAYTTAVSVNLQTATATGVGGVFANIQKLTGGSEMNTLVGLNQANVWNLTAMNGGSVTGSATVTFTAFQSLQGGTASNTFVFSDGAGISGNLDGGGGSLDYSAYTSSVIVDLQAGSATGIGGSLTDIQNVTGGTGGGAGLFNILVGNGGNILTGGAGRRNLLIAGSSASTLQGGDDDDILIGGTTAYDKDIASLLAILNYWSTTSDDYATRVGNLLAGNGVPLLDPTTVTSNGGGNTLTGGSGLNLYYGNNTDNTDFDPTSTAVFIPV